MEDEVLFKNVSAIRKKEINALFKLTAIKPLLLGGVCCPLILIALGVVWFLTGFEDTAIWLFCFGGAFLIVYPLFFCLGIRKMNSKLIDGKRLVNTFEFKQDGLVVTSENLAGTERVLVGTSNIPYGELFKVVCTNDYMFLFVDRQQSFILDYEGMLQGDAEQFIQFMKSKAGQLKDKRKNKGVKE